MHKYTQPYRPIGPSFVMPPRYGRLLGSDMPMVIKEAVNLYGTYEWAGDDNNPVILEWAKEIGRKVGIDYHSDSIPWCGLAVGICVHRAGFELPDIAVRAKAWLDWGQVIHIDDAAIGDVLVFDRKGGGHVGFYAAEDKTHFHVLGGNQSDQFNIMRISKKRCIGVRRCPWHIAQPLGVRKLIVSASGAVSENEA